MTVLRRLGPRLPTSCDIDRILYFLQTRTLRFTVDQSSKTMAKRDPIFLIVICRKVRKQETKNNATDPLGITHNDISLAHPAGICQRMYHIKSVGYVSKVGQCSST